MIKKNTPTRLYLSTKNGRLNTSYPPNQIQIMESSATVGEDFNSHDRPENGTASGIPSGNVTQQ